MANYRKIDEFDKVNIKKLYNENTSILKISKIINLSRHQIRKFLLEENISIKTYKEINKKYSLNDTYFKTIDSKDKAYFLGLIIADGNVFSNKLKISLQEEDGYILELFKKYIKYTGVIFKRKKEGNRKLQDSLTITNTNIIKDLLKLGVIENKTHFTYFPEIPEEFHSHFIRGVFDGDGCIYLSKGRKNTSNLNGNFSIVGNIDLIEKIQEILIKECELNKTKLNSFKKTSNNIVNLIYGGNRNCIKIRKYLYNNCEDLYLTRKKEKMDIVEYFIFNNVNKCLVCDKKVKTKGYCQYHYKKYIYLNKWK